MRVAKEEKTAIAQRINKAGAIEKGPRARPKNRAVKIVAARVIARYFWRSL